MNNQDPIADMLTRIRNANRVGRRMVVIPKSKICSGIAQVLKDEGYIEQYDVIEDEQQGQIRVKLKYSMNGDKVIHMIDRTSKPYDDFQTWCREIVWWGNKKGAYLYSPRAAQITPELAGHY